jgi:hypothetical protein
MGMSWAYGHAAAARPVSFTVLSSSASIFVTQRYKAQGNNENVTKKVVAVGASELAFSMQQSVLHFNTL